MYRCGEIHILYSPPVLRRSDYLFTLKLMEEYIPLIEKKNWLEAFALAILLILNTKPSVNITQKLCWELLHSPTKGKKSLEVLKYYRCVVDGKWPYPPDMRVTDMEDDKSQWTKPAGLICKLLPWNYPQVLNLLNSMGKYILTASATKNLTIEEYVPLLIKEILKDDFWKKQLTWENFVRKFSYLDGKFHKLVPKKITWWMESITEIF